MPHSKDNQCVLDANGHLKDALQILFFHSPSSKVPLPTVSNDKSQGKKQTDNISDNKLPFNKLVL